MEALLDELSVVVSTAVFAFASLVIFAACFTCFRAGCHAGRLFGTQLGIGLEFLLAAGLIRLTAVETFAMPGITASIIAVRRAIVLGVGYAARAAG